MARMMPQFAVGASAYHALYRAPTMWWPGPVRDAESFCRSLLDDAFDKMGMFLRPEFYEDSLQELIFTLQRLERKFDPERTKTFESYATWIISQRAIDVGPRRVLGRNGNRLQEYVFDELEPGVERGGPGFSEPPLTVDQSFDRGRDDRRVQVERDRLKARAAILLGC